MESPKLISKVDDQQTPIKKQSIGLTPEMRRLDRLRLSSGKRGQGVVGDVDTEPSVAHSNLNTSEDRRCSRHDTLIERSTVPRDVEYPLQMAWIQR